MSLDIHPTSTISEGAVERGQLDRLAASIDRLGIDMILPATLEWLAGRARTVGVHPEVATLLIDRSAPDVVRRRAFGLVSRRLATASAVAVSTGPRLAA
jgi:hypothetical protein